MSGASGITVGGYLVEFFMGVTSIVIDSLQNPTPLAAPRDIIACHITHVANKVKVGWGFAVRNPEDKPDPKYARLVALKRALKSYDAGGKGLPLNYSGYAPPTPFYIYSTIVEQWHLEEQREGMAKRLEEYKTAVTQWQQHLEQAVGRGQRLTATEAMIAEMQEAKRAPGYRKQISANTYITPNHIPMSKIDFVAGNRYKVKPKGWRAAGSEQLRRLKSLGYSWSIDRARWEKLAPFFQKPFSR